MVDIVFDSLLACGVMNSLYGFVIPLTNDSLYIVILIFTIGKLTVIIRLS